MHSVRLKSHVTSTVWSECLISAICLWHQVQVRIPMADFMSINSDLSEEMIQARKGCDEATKFWFV